MSGDRPDEELSGAADGAPGPTGGAEDLALRRRAQEARSGFGGRFGAAGLPVEKSDNFRDTARRLLAQLGPERWGAAVVVVLAVGSVVLYVLGPRILARATNLIASGLLGPTHRIDFTAMARTLAVACAVYAGSAALAWSQGWILAGVVQRTMFRLRRDVEDKINRLPLPYVDGVPRGDLLSRVTNDIDNISQSLQQTLSQTITSVLQLVGVLVMMLTISWVLALVTALIVPASLFVLKYVAARSRPRFVDQWRHTGALNAQVEEAVTGHALVTAFGRQDEVAERFDAVNDLMAEATFGAQFASGIIQPALMFLGNLNYVAIAVVGGLRVASGSLTIGDVQAFIQYSRQFTQPLTQVASMFNILQSGVASAERVFEFLDTPEESDESALPEHPETPVGRVCFEHVRFSYDPAVPLIEDLSLVVEPGQTVAIVGPTGAGKTTLVNLVMRFYEVDGGRITLDGTDLTELRRRDLRRGIGMVLQDTWLFGGTIHDNIAFGRADATTEEVRAAARAAYVDRFVHSLPDGYDTVLDDEGTRLSAGEKQLLTIARAFLADPAILILDEATSSVDTRTEVLIQEAMAGLRASRTSFVIAHRLSTIRDADVILVMERGSIVEQGSHDDLLAAGGAYARLHAAQFAGAATDLD